MITLVSVLDNVTIISWCQYCSWKSQRGMIVIMEKDYSKFVLSQKDRERWLDLCWVNKGLISMGPLREKFFSVFVPNRHVFCHFKILMLASVVDGRSLQWTSETAWLEQAATCCYSCEAQPTMEASSFDSIKANLHRASGQHAHNDKSCSSHDWQIRWGFSVW